MGCKAMKIQCILTIGLIASGGAIADDHCKFERDIEQTLSAQDHLRLDAGAGKLTITGDPTIQVIEIQAQACASSAKLLEQISLRTSEGRAAEIETIIPKFSGWLSGNRYASVNLELTVPTSVALEIHDGSGSIQLLGVGPTILDDGSGSIDARDIRGNIELSDGSGSIEIRDVDGAVIINDDGSGSIDIVNVRDHVEIANDGSGSIKVHDIGGDVRIGNDGSGSISVNRVTGNFLVRSDGSGSIDFADVQGELDIPDNKLRRK